MAPRTETIVKTKAVNSDLVEKICPKINILDGVYLCPSIVKVDKENNILTSILNTTDQIVNIKNIEIALDPIINQNDAKKLCKRLIYKYT